MQFHHLTTTQKKTKLSYPTQDACEMESSKESSELRPKKKWQMTKPCTFFQVESPQICQQHLRIIARQNVEELMFVASFFWGETSRFRVGNESIIF